MSSSMQQQVNLAMAEWLEVMKAEIVEEVTKQFKEFIVEEVISSVTKNHEKLISSLLELSKETNDKNKAKNTEAPRNDARAGKAPEETGSTLDSLPHALQDTEDEVS